MDKTRKPVRVISRPEKFPAIKHNVLLQFEFGDLEAHMSEQSKADGKT
jgi:hypothetical protein